MYGAYRGPCSAPARSTEVGIRLLPPPPNHGEVPSPHPTIQVSLLWHQTTWGAMGLTWLYHTPPL